MVAIAPLIVFIELFLADFIFLIYQKRRPHTILRLIGIFIFTYGYLIFWTKYSNSFFETFFYLCLFFLSSFFIYFVFDFDIRTSFFWGIAGISVQHACYSLWMILVNISSTNSSTMKISLIISFAIIYGIQFAYTRKYNRTNLSSYSENDNRIFIFISAIIIGTTIFLNSARTFFSPNTDTATTIIISIYSLICSFLSLFVLLIITKTYRLQTELEVLKHLWHSDQKQYELAKQNMEMLNLYCHDLKHIMNAKANEANNSIQPLKLFDSIVHTDSQALDVILTEKRLYCERHQITLTTMVDGKILDFIPTADLYSLFGNLISNAIEAVSSIPDLNQRIISLIVKKKGNFVFIHIENFYQGTLTFVDDLPKSKKTDSPYHGYGLKSVKMLVERYNGNFTINSENSIFNVNILIPDV